MEEQEITYSAIIPLIGGMVMGAKAATGKDPEYIVSYDAFAGNDAHTRENFDVPFGLIQDSDDVVWDREMDLKKVDFVVSLCPCAGLSALNSSTKEGSEKKRGSDAIQNDWMYKSSRFVLEHIQPRVLWGENAPGLFTNMGAGVVEKLRAIAKEYGYSFSMVKTSTVLHGIPQKRDRSFYFFWDNENAPYMKYTKAATISTADYLKQIPADASYQNEFNQGSQLSDDPLVQWVTQVEKKSLSEIADAGHKTLLLYLFSSGKVDAAIEYLRTRDDKPAQAHLRLLERAKVKKVWDSTPHLLSSNDPSMAVVGRLFQLGVHPSGERWLNVREYMHMMGIPHNYKLAHKGFANITQNVPVNTARDWTYQVLEYIKGNLEFSNSDFIKQNNYKQSEEQTEDKTSIKNTALF
jgi:site-specific DNA-cytosine methylase